MVAGMEQAHVRARFVCPCLMREMLRLTLNTVEGGVHAAALINGHFEASVV